MIDDWGRKDGMKDLRQGEFRRLGKKGSEIFCFEGVLK
jgi:hypothetical protein